MSDLITCPNCNAQIQDYSGICPHCGVSQQQVRIRSDAPASICPKCGAVNQQGYNYCKKCGFSPSDAVSNGVYTPAQGGEYSPVAPNPYVQSGSYTQQNYAYQNYSGAYPFYYDPYGGINPSETIEGISVADIAVFVGENSNYYIPKFFKFYKTGSKVSWNWSSFFISGLWLLYRRMIKIFFILLGIIFVFLLAVASISGLNQYLFISGSYDSPVPFILISILCSLLSLTPHIIFAMHSNYLYYRYCIEKIREIRKCCFDPMQYHAQLAYRGRTKLSYPFIFIGIWFAGVFIIAIMLSLLAVLLSYYH